MTGQDFLTVSNRGRMAFFLCCAEQALIQEGQTTPMHPRWIFVIEKYWNALGWDDIDELEYFLSEFSPRSFIEIPSTYSQYVEDGIEDGGPNYIDSESEWNELDIIFRSKSMACYFLNFMDIYYNDGIYGAPDEPGTVKLIDQFLGYIHSNNLSLPVLEKFQQCVRGGDFNFGEPVTREMFFD
jgi:hypothetical protein